MTMPTPATQEPLSPALMTWMRQQIHLWEGVVKPKHLLWLSDQLSAQAVKDGLVTRAHWYDLCASDVSESLDAMRPWQSDHGHHYDLFVCWAGRGLSAQSDMTWLKRVDALLNAGATVVIMTPLEHGASWWREGLFWSPLPRTLRQSADEQGWELSRSGRYLWGRLDAGAPVGPDRYWREFLGRFFCPWLAKVAVGVWCKERVALTPASAGVLTES